MEIEDQKDQLDLKDPKVHQALKDLLTIPIHMLSLIMSMEQAVHMENLKLRKTVIVNIEFLDRISEINQFIA